MHARKNILFYTKVDARDVLEPQWQQYTDHANYIQHRVLVGRTFWHLDDATNQYTLLKSAYLRNVVGSQVLLPLLTEMQRVGLIDCDHDYIEGKKSFGYRIGDRFQSANTIRVQCRSHRLHEKIMNVKRQEYRNYAKVHRHLFDWLRRVEMDLPSALRIVDQIPHDGQTMTLQELRDLNQLAVRMLSDKQFELSVCHYGRVHSNITRLIRALRRELRISGTPLVEIDVSNSQPLFLTLCVLAGFGEGRTSSSAISHSFFSPGDPVIPNSSGLPSYSSFPSPTSYTMLTSDVSSSSTNELMAFSGSNLAVPVDLRIFKGLCEEGRIYEHLMHRINWAETKDKFKGEEVFRVLYGANTPRNLAGEFQPSKLQPVLESDFPTVWGFIRNYKREHGYAELARQMQREESRLMIEGVCGRLMTEHPDCPLVTVHDSILTTPGWVETVSATIKDEFAHLGIHPTLKTK